MRCQVSPLFVLTLLFSVLTFPCALSSKIIYVDGDATRANNGTSWIDAYNYLQDALADANSSEKPVEIRVAQGIYKPDQGANQMPGDREATFRLINGVTLKGGYAGFGESDPNARDIRLYETILSGDLADNDVSATDPCELLTEPTRAENSYNIVTAKYCSRSAVLDAFTVRSGNAISDRHQLEQHGAGLLILGDALSPSCPSVMNCTFVDNSAYLGGAVFVIGGCPELISCRFLRNAATQGGALLDCAVRQTGGQEPICEFLLKECVFASNHAVDAGGGMFCNRNTTLLNCMFTSNFAVSGGGMYNFEGSVTLINCAFLHNSARFGGGIYSQSRRLEPIPRGNLAQSGDGIHSQDTGPEVTIAGCTFAHNSAEGGGGMYNVGPDSRMSNCAFKDNWGGGMYNGNGSNPTLIGCAFSGNVGFGMHNYYSSPTLTDCTFEHNCGGGMYNHIGSNPTLTNCTFNCNFGPQGGGMSNSKSNPTLVHCTFRGNRAVGDTNVIAAGGAVHNYVSSPLLSHCIFTGNSADQGGGLSNCYGGPTLSNCILSGNLAANYGGGMSNYEATGKLLNCTFCNNRAPDGAGLYNNMGPNPRRELVITNCILWDGRTGVFNTNGSEITITYSSVQGGWPGEGNIDTDPCFAELGYWDPNGTPDDPNDDFWVDGDYHLKSQAGRWDPAAQSWVNDDVTSPCIDAGDPRSPIGLEPFPNGGVVNMGAYGGTAEASKSYFGEPVCETIVAGDINGDCKVDLADFAIMALHWLEEHKPTVFGG